MLFGAAIAHNSNSVPLLVFGGSWAAVGGVALWRARHIAHELRFEDGQVTFVFAARELTVPATDVVEVRYGRFDMNRMGVLLVRTLSQGTVKSVPRLDGLFDFLAAVRDANSQLAVRL